MNLIWTKSARADISNIENYYTEVDVPKEIIHSVIFEIYKTGKLIKQFPLIASVLDEGTIRKFPISKYPYVILYKVEVDAVKIIRVLDTRNNNF